MKANGINQQMRDNRMVACVPELGTWLHNIDIIYQTTLCN